MVLRMGWLTGCILILSCAIPRAGAQVYQRDFPPEEFRARWERVFDRIGEDAVAIVQGAPDPGGFVYPRQERMDGFRRLLDLPETVAAHSLVVLGYPAETLPREDRYKEQRVHRDGWC